jgi:hypothetical protein
MAKQKAPDARLERNTADGLFVKPSNIKRPWGKPTASYGIDGITLP